MRLLLAYPTKVGIFYIGQSTDGRFHPIFDNESLGSYAEAWLASEDLANDVTFSVLHPETGELLDTSTFGIPEDPTEWERV
ncbi:hypothetical protein CVO_06020 [Sulfurimonas sp. CVO]|uniref:hypothetical protein n=1 Tax=Sulfurimonas sp. CVO TaxID=2283483 RepID=UPI00132F3E08|nr:hypothetical protein [Sulfurimonas sp. CVO]QHG91417.1 hypothetical protein CVO_06020 [Sulfurimonas sp. CVO]